MAGRMSEVCDSLRVIGKGAMLGHALTIFLQANVAQMRGSEWSKALELLRSTIGSIPSCTMPLDAIGAILEYRAGGKKGFVDLPREVRELVRSLAPDEFRGRESDESLEINA